MMKKISILIVLALVLCLCAACAEEGVLIEVVKIDGISVVMLTPEDVTQQARSLAKGAASAEQAGLALPPYLTLIEDEAFAGIAAARIEVSDKVVSIGAKAFADCKNLREIVIPKTVRHIDDSAFDGCEKVTVFGATGSEAERVAKLCGFAFVDPSAPADPPAAQKIPAAPVLPMDPLH